MYNRFDLYFQLEDDDNLILFNDVININHGSTVDKSRINKFFKDNDDMYNIYYISKSKHFDKYIWVSDNYDADVVILKTSDIDNFIKHDVFKNVILIVDDESEFLNSMLYLYVHSGGWIDFKIKNDFDKNLLYDQFLQLSEFISTQIKNGNFVHIKQLNSFFIKEKFSEFGENAAFVSPNLDVYYHPSFYYTSNEKGMINKLEDFTFNEKTIHSSKPHIVCHTCECFYCDRNIFHNYVETTELKVPAFTECRKTEFISIFSKRIFNNIQDKIEINEVEILDKLNTKFNPELEFVKLNKNLVFTNNIKNVKLNYLIDGKEDIDWNYSR